MIKYFHQNDRPVKRELQSTICNLIRYNLPSNRRGTGINVFTMAGPLVSEGAKQWYKLIGTQGRIYSFEEQKAIYLVQQQSLKQLSESEKKKIRIKVGDFFEEIIKHCTRHHGGGKYIFLDFDEMRTLHSIVDNNLTKIEKFAEVSPQEVVYLSITYSVNRVNGKSKEENYLLNKISFAFTGKNIWKEEIRWPLSYRDKTAMNTIIFKFRKTT